MSARKEIPKESLVVLKRRLDKLSPRDHQRRRLMKESAEFYGVSESTLYRKLQKYITIKSVRRSDFGKPRALSQKEMEFYCELIAAIKIRTSNKKNRYLSTSEAIHLLENYGINTSDGYVKPPKSVLKPTTINRYLKYWGYDYKSLKKKSPSVRFQAQYSNECWQFDLSPSDLKTVQFSPKWLLKRKGNPILMMLYSVVDDRSGTAYQEYRCVYGEDTESALRFLFNAMSAKKDKNVPFQGIPDMIYMDKGPISKSQVFHNVMKCLNINVKLHQKGNSRAKGKVERPFRTVKEMHETLYHFHEPSSESEANAWLSNYINKRYNNMNHRIENHSRIEDWIKNKPPSGIREMCDWERYSTFAREPETRTVDSDAKISINNLRYDVDTCLAGKKVKIWLGIFDKELFVENDGERFGPYLPSGGPIPLHKYRSFKKNDNQVRTERIEKLSKDISLPKTALERNEDIIEYDFDEEMDECYIRPLMIRIPLNCKFR
ncbi:integrase, catalytic region [Candidatus Magnetomorum sp. HK-1]|nr:integrase, catalytic region [Candidatus Magnetomorum sp. HK-1]